MKQKPKLLLTIFKTSLKKISLLSYVLQGLSFAKRGYANAGVRYRRKQEVKIFFYILFNPKFTQYWFNILHSVSFRPIFEQRPRLYVKPFRAYISTEWRKKKKVKVILDTYRFIQNNKNILGPILTQTEDVIIATMVFNDTHTLSLQLGYDERFRKEGELVLSLDCAQFGGRIISLAFSFEEIVDGSWICIIGCVQGNNNAYTQGAFKVIQKLLHGLRPNAFLVYSLQELAKNLGVSTILCAGDSIQAYRQKHAIHLPGLHDIYFDYDKFWHEVGGKSTVNGWFELPLLPVRKRIQEIESHKRSMYRKRYEMLDHIASRICNHFNPQEIIIKTVNEYSR